MYFYEKSILWEIERSELVVHGFIKIDRGRLAERNYVRLDDLEKRSVKLNFKRVLVSHNSVPLPTPTNPVKDTVELNVNAIDSKSRILYILCLPFLTPTRVWRQQND